MLCAEPGGCVFICTLHRVRVRLLPRRDRQDAVPDGGVGVGVELLLVVAPAVRDIIAVGVELPVSELKAPFCTVKCIAVKFVAPDQLRRAALLQKLPLEQRQINGIQPAVRVPVRRRSLFRGQRAAAEQPVPQQSRILRRTGGVCARRLCAARSGQQQAEHGQQRRRCQRSFHSSPLPFCIAAIPHRADGADVPSGGLCAVLPLCSSYRKAGGMSSPAGNRRCRCTDLPVRRAGLPPFGSGIRSRMPSGRTGIRAAPRTEYPRMKRECRSGTDPFSAPQRSCISFSKVVRTYC